MKIKTKDIVAIIISLVFIIGSVYALLKLTSKPKPVENKIDNALEEAKTVTKELDEDTLKEIKSLTEYSKPALEGIGKENPFAPVN